eukprot:6187823-Pleurochrysis_carterae.AAC.2
MNKKGELVAVITARSPCMMVMPCEGCAGANGLEHVRVRVHVDLVAAVVGPSSVCICRKRDDGK